MDKKNCIEVNEMSEKDLADLKAAGISKSQVSGFWVNHDLQKDIRPTFNEREWSFIRHMFKQLPGGVVQINMF